MKWRAVASIASFLAGACGCASTDNATAEAHVDDPPDAAGGANSPSERPPFDAAVYGDGAPWNDPSRLSVTQRVCAWLDTDPEICDQPLDGVEVCAHGYGPEVVPCVRTDADGYYTLRGLPKYADVAITLEKEGFGSTVIPIRTEAVDSDFTLITPFAARMFSTSSYAALHGVIGRGGIMAIAVDINLAPLPGTTISLLDSDVPAVYIPNFEPMPDEQTGAAALFGDLSEGQYRVQFEHPDFDCEIAGRGGVNWARFGFLDDQINVARVPVIEGYLTSWAGGYCAFPKPDGGASP